ncbi:serine dehydratase subunit alpha family protein [Fictibacillus phosphorivorans]|uniref:L-cysteine desulfidase family protein n=1 Tax=Fictibacillus phosphorivorans TaxID=1221500 RepID=UPI00203CFF3A|nr:L-serine ammonia-lyase, iron-sulfur-dependent, subunit alpha [Fictibacillus phosphorivorans]MCM3719008.1 L-serine ammonia-lyase, iron-sulfur-dependent, subunit alpha [Fictibacillus phosphorivorans]MCM3776630.1 L-serine ammonia-lyase, iron-sulfur-dependent, subunit alpha [Fictibacillus phosphorivorans]
MERIYHLLEKELVIALGCTEPVAIALATATAKEYTKENVTSISVSASGNVIKNALSVGIPGMSFTGIDFTAALGVIAGDPSKGLRVLEGVTKIDEQAAMQLVHEGKVHVQTAVTPEKLYIEVHLVTASDNINVIISGDHTNVSYISVNGNVILDQSDTTKSTPEKREKFPELTVDDLYTFITEVPVNRLELVKRSVELNRAICEEGLTNEYGLKVGKTLYDQTKSGMLTNDLATYSMALSAAGSDARMAGSTMPVMANSGSGNQGIAVTMPVVAAAEKIGTTEEKMLRAVTLSHLLSIYMKSKFGRLSALCGVTVAGASASAAITYLLSDDLKKIKSAIQNTLGNVSGMVCDGAKAGCAMKVATCSSAAVQSAILASQGLCIPSTNGFIEEDVEQTIENFCRLGNETSSTTDTVLLDMMVNKKISAKS